MWRASSMRSGPRPAVPVARPGAAGAVQHRANTRHQLSRRERLGLVIVGAGRCSLLQTGLTTCHPSRPARPQQALIGIMFHNQETIKRQRQVPNKIIHARSHSEEVVEVHRAIILVAASLNTLVLGWRRLVSSL